MCIHAEMKIGAYVLRMHVFEVVYCCSVLNQSMHAEHKEPNIIDMRHVDVFKDRIDVYEMLLYDVDIGRKHLAKIKQYLLNHLMHEEEHLQDDDVRTILRFAIGPRLTCTPDTLLAALGNADLLQSICTSVDALCGMGCTIYLTGSTL